MQKEKKGKGGEEGSLKVSTRVVEGVKKLATSKTSINSLCGWLIGEQLEDNKRNILNCIACSDYIKQSPLKERALSIPDWEKEGKFLRVALSCNPICALGLFVSVSLDEKEAVEPILADYFRTNAKGLLSTLLFQKKEPIIVAALILNPEIMEKEDNTVQAGLDFYRVSLVRTLIGCIVATIKTVFRMISM